MNELFHRPKELGEVLKLVFSIIKSHFSKLIGIYLVLVAPIYLLDAIIMGLTGVELIGDQSLSATWYESIISTSTPAPLQEGSVWLTITGIISGMVLLPIAYGAVFFAMSHIRNSETYTTSSVIKQSLARFWPIFGSHLLFFLILSGLTFVFLIPVAMFGVISPNIMILSFIGFAILVGYWITRWSFYLIKVTLGEEAPGFSKSWDFTDDYVWPLMGFYIVIFLITMLINTVIEYLFGFLLGNGVLQMFVLNITTLLTSLIFFVGYSVKYFDVKARRGEW
ncbi:hypothetical protein SAMN05421676_10784 [Salinibacillus kushneri]|uniref:Membrane domain of glycerophosphoryl diester phosphodiesterase n=1 Tax=Salinibacillus kushneri TaxID=237682 RepID=A0A1I0GNG2_9BACI|nr:hypothetical protein [Salinibacillus kushneri]SET72473.1 hypothetical protein SAMN05421676_10784 [Salinibacillus kushneri]